MRNDTTDKTLHKLGETAKVEPVDEARTMPEVEPPPMREPLEVVQSYGSASAAEMERLAVQAIGYDDREQSIAILELLTQLKRGSGQALTARTAALRASSELLDEAADLLAINAQRQRRIAENPAALNERQLRYAFDRITDLTRSGSPSCLLVLLKHMSTLADAGDFGLIRAHSETLIDYLYQEHNRYDEPRDKWVAEEIIHFADSLEMDDQHNSESARTAASHRADSQAERRAEASQESHT